MADRRGQVLRALDDVIDPCAKAYGHKLGMTAMGMVEAVDVSGSLVTVVLLPTTLSCLFRGVLAEQCESRLLDLSWCTSARVSMSTASEPWDEDRMAGPARDALLARRRGPAAELHATNLPLAYGSEVHRDP